MMNRSTRRNEAGFTMVLVLILLVAVALVVAAIASATSDDLRNSSNLASQRSLEYAADGATSIAVQNVRYSGIPYSPSTPMDCLPGTSTNPSVLIDNVSIWVFCSQQSFVPISGVTRMIYFYACASSSCSASNSILTALVTFDDYSVSNTYNCNPGGLVSTCGSAMTINSWIVETGNR
jgi:hypothetical protein